MAALNDTSVMPTHVQGVYPGVMNTSTHSGNQPEDAYAEKGPMSGHEVSSSDPTDPHATGGILSGHVKPSDPKANDSVEGAPGVIESTELAPLGEEKIAADPGITTQATTAAQKAYEAVMGDGK